MTVGPVKQLQTCGKLLRQPVLAWVFAYYVVMTVLNHVPYEFYQPYIDLALDDHMLLSKGTTLATGVHVAAVMLIASWFAARSIRLRDRFGLSTTLLSAAALQTLIIFAMGALLHPLVVVLALARSVPRAMMTAPINAAVTPRVNQSQRATLLSIQSLAGRLAFSLWLVVLSLITASDQADGWAGLSKRLLISAGVGVIAIIALTATRRFPTATAD